MALEIQQGDRTVEIFDNFYNQQLNVPADQWDIVYSFFLGAQSKNTESAKRTAAQFATVLFRIAQESGTDIMVFLDYMKGIGDNKLKLNAEMAFYLNLLRTKTALYGVANQPAPNQAVQRNVIL
jgi:hypothetical protein